MARSASWKRPRSKAPKADSAFSTSRSRWAAVATSAALRMSAATSAGRLRLGGRAARAAPALPAAAAPVAEVFGCGSARPAAGAAGAALVGPCAWSAWCRPTLAGAVVTGSTSPRRAWRDGACAGAGPSPRRRSPSFRSRARRGRVAYDFAGAPGGPRCPTSRRAWLGNGCYAFAGGGGPTAAPGRALLLPGVRVAVPAAPSRGGRERGSRTARCGDGRAARWCPGAGAVHCWVDPGDRIAPSVAAGLPRCVRVGARPPDPSGRSVRCGSVAVAGARRGACCSRLWPGAAGHYRFDRCGRRRRCPTNGPGLPGGAAPNGCLPNGAPLASGPVPHLQAGVPPPGATARAPSRGARTSFSGRPAEGGAGDRPGGSAGGARTRGVRGAGGRDQRQKASDASLSWGGLGSGALRPHDAGSRPRRPARRRARPIRTVATPNRVGRQRAQPQEEHDDHGDTTNSEAAPADPSKTSPAARRSPRR